MPQEIAVTKAYHAGCVGVRFALQAGGYGPSINVQGRAELTSEQARELAANLLRDADVADAKVATEREKAARRQAYRAREIAAGRMQVLVPRQRITP